MYIYIYNIILCHICRNESKDKQGVIIHARGHKSSCPASVDLYTFIPTFIRIYYIILDGKLRIFFSTSRVVPLRFKNLYLCNYHHTLIYSVQCLTCYNIARRLIILCRYYRFY